ncbi:YheC/YheD family protein [Paenibacillus whitsoniae]|nr:YheC/YheD family protein [Paenibacillus whitsoniae]
MAKLTTSKWTKHKILRRMESLRTHLPDTAWLSDTTLWSMLDKYNQIIIKPTGSYGGHGVIRISKVETASYEIHNGAKRTLLIDKSAVSRYVRKKAGRNYIVQQRVHLATVKGRPFDLRVMVQRRPGGPWQVTGKLAKVAGRGYIVTNVRRSHGRVVSLPYALRHSEVGGMSAELTAKVNQVALKAARQLHPSYRWVKTMGVDMAIDKKGHVWIIEVNFAPMLELFLKLADKSTYRTIKSFHASRRKQNSLR